MANAEAPIIKEQSIIDTSKLVNIHVIEDRLYYVYSTSVCVSGCLIWKSDSLITASCICGHTIALVLECGRLVIPSHKMLADLECKDIAEELVGMTSHKLFRRNVAATASGTYVAINVSKTSILIYKYNGRTLQFSRSINVPKRGSFQITGDQVPYLWNLYANTDSYRIDVFDASELSPIKFPDEPIAKCPVVPFDTGRKIGSLDETRCFITSCHTESLEGILCYIDGTLSYLSLKSAMIGNLVSGLTRFPSTWRNFICTTQSPDGMRTYICRQTDRKIVQLKSIQRGNDFEPIFSEAIGKIPFQLGNQKRCLIAVVYASVSTDDNKAIVDSHNLVTHNDVRIICEHAKSGQIRKFDFDSRKSPKKVLVLDDTSIKLMTTATPIKTTSNSSGITNVKEVLFSTSANMLLLSTVDSVKTRCFVNFSETEFDCGYVHTADVVKNHTLALISPRDVKLYSTMAPYKQLGNVSLPNNGEILDASIGSRNILLRSIDEVNILSVEPGFPVRTLLSGIPTSFVSCSNNRCNIGVDVSLWHSLKALESKYSYSLESSQPFCDPVNDFPQGAIVTFDETSENPEPFSITFHKYVPTAIHISMKNKVQMIVYGYDGIVCHFNLVDKKVTYTDLNTPLKWVGIQSDSIVLIGIGIVIISAHGCHHLLDASRSHKFSKVSSASVINDEVIAYVSKNELRFLAGVDLGGAKPPTVLKKMYLPSAPPSVKLDMLLVPSQRLLILHGENIFMVFDSITFEQILVTGITAVWCSNIALWKFTSNGTTFEHLLFADGNGWIESYSFYREGMTLECHCKYRAAIFDHASGQNSREIIYCTNDAIHIARGEVLATITPSNNKRRFSRFKNSIISISHTCSYLIVTTMDILYVLDDKNTQLANISIENVDLEDLDDALNAMEIESFEHGSAENRVRGFVGHICSTIDHNGDSRFTYILLLIADQLRTKRTRLALVKFDSESKSLSPINYNFSGRIDKVMHLQADPEVNPDIPNKTLRAYAAMADHSISSIEVSPSQNFLQNNLRIFF